MAEILTEFPETRTKYPWGEWFDGHVWKLTQGVDFQSSAQKFAAVARSRAHTRGIKARIHVAPDKRAVFIMALPTKGDEAFAEFCRGIAGAEEE